MSKLTAEEFSAMTGGSSQGSVFAVVGPWAPEYRKIIKIEMTPDGPQSTVVQDYKLTGALNSVMEDALADLADDDDPPEQQQMLMSAWQSIAMYLASCDDEDKAGALAALKMISDLMSGPNAGSGPYPTGTFGATTQAAAADTKKKPAPDAPKVLLGKNGKPLPPWMQPKKKAADKAATEYDCPQCSRDFASSAGLINHLATVHSKREHQPTITPANDKD